MYSRPICGMVAVGSPSQARIEYACASDGTFVAERTVDLMLRVGPLKVAEDALVRARRQDPDPAPIITIEIYRAANLVFAKVPERLLNLVNANV